MYFGMEAKGDGGHLAAGAPRATVLQVLVQRRGVGIGLELAGI